MPASTFFQKSETAADSLYSRIARPANRYERKAQRFTERMWDSCRHLIDADAPERARKHDFYSVWWELYVAYSLSRAGISLVPRKERPKVTGKGCPDLLAENPRVWIEAVMPQSGNGPDALIPPPLGQAYAIPLDDIILRLITAIQSKGRVIKEYIGEATIPSSDATVIAVSSGRFPMSYRFTGYPVPDPVRAVLGVRHLAVHFAVETKARIGRSVEACAQVCKKSGNAVETDFFLRKESGHVSALLWSDSDCVNYERVPGSDFILVHNPNARVPLPRTWLPVGRQYSVEGDSLRCDAATPRAKIAIGCAVRKQ
jgi:hypothetical protein